MLKNFSSKLETLDGIETEFVRTLYYDLPKNYCSSYESKENLRFCTILEGKKELNLGNESFTYTSDKFLILPAHTSVDMNIPVHTKALVFELSEDLIKKVAKNITVSGTKKTQNSIPRHSFILGSCTKNLESDIKQMQSLTKSKSNREPFLIDLFAQKLVYDLLKIYSLDELLSIKGTTCIDKAAYYIKSHTKEHISVEKLAQMVGMSSSNFSHNFKKYYGMSPQKYINEAKLKLAIKLLKDYSVTEVAFELGFESMSYFIKLFKNKYKLTPKQFQLSYF